MFGLVKKIKKNIDDELQGEVNYYRLENIVYYEKINNCQELPHRENKKDERNFKNVRN